MTRKLITPVLKELSLCLLAQRTLDWIGFHILQEFKKGVSRDVSYMNVDASLSFWDPFDSEVLHILHTNSSIILLLLNICMKGIAVLCCVEWKGEEMCCG